MPEDETCSNPESWRQMRSKEFADQDLASGSRYAAMCVHHCVAERNQGGAPGFKVLFYRVCYFCHL